MTTATIGASPATTGGGAAGAVLIIGILGMVILPLPAVALDALLALGLCISVMVLMLAIYVERPLDFSSFPSLLLLVTLFRLALNLATTRRILLHGGEGFDAAGAVIRTFGEFAVGGNFVVGGVIFLILVIVNFVVITKGSERISEVSARFTLDSMPGKQMAIDADLAAGLIDESVARARRKVVEQEADFHGAMDGASKFVRGDAIAGLMITAINVLGGFIIGVAQHGMSLADSAKTFMLLSIGDGLLTQIPALLVSTGAALLSTRGATSGELGKALQTELLGSSRPLRITAITLVAIAAIPGMPHLILLGLAGATMLLAQRAGKPRAPSSDAAKKIEPKVNDAAAHKSELEALLPLDLLTLEVGLDLLPLVDAQKSGELLSRIASLRKQVALELGIMVPPIHVRDDLGLKPGGYRILISGVKVADGELRIGRLLAIDPTERIIKSLPGDVVKEPTFGLPAKWIGLADRTRVESQGATVVDASAVVATHLTEIVRRHAHELLGRREAQELIDLAAKQNSKVVEELIPHLLPLGEVIKVLKNLLMEGVSVRDSRTILETLADCAAQQKDPQELTELVRQRLARQISHAHLSDRGELCALVLDPRAEDLVRHPGRATDPQALSRLAAALEEATRKAAERDDPAVAVVAPDVRRAVAAIALRHAPGLAVLSYRELDPSVRFVSRGLIAF